MNLLAVDSASSILSVAVSRGETIHYAETEAGMKHSELVMDLIDSQMKDACLEPKDLDGVLCMGGPGSFTGLRIGYSIAKGLALSLSVPFAPIPTLDCIALPFCKRGSVLAVMQARKNAYFYASFKDGERAKPDEDAETDKIAQEIERLKKDAEKITLTGPASASLCDALSQELKNCICLEFENRGYAKEIITIAKMRKIFDNNNDAYLYLGPEYIRKTDTELNLAENEDKVTFCGGDCGFDKSFGKFIEESKNK